MIHSIAKAAPSAIVNAPKRPVETALAADLPDSDAEAASLDEVPLPPLLSPASPLTPLPSLTEVYTTTPSVEYAISPSLSHLPSLSLHGETSLPVLTLLSLLSLKKTMVSCIILCMIGSRGVRKNREVAYDGSQHPTTGEVLLDRTHVWPPAQQTCSAVLRRYVVSALVKTFDASALAQMKTTSGSVPKLAVHSLPMSFNVVFSSSDCARAGAARATAKRAAVVKCMMKRIV